MRSISLRTIHFCMYLSHSDESNLKCPQQVCFQSFFPSRGCYRETVEPNEAGYWQKRAFWRLHPPLALACSLFVLPRNTGDIEVTVKDDAILHHAFTTQWTEILLKLWTKRNSSPFKLFLEGIWPQQFKRKQEAWSGPFASKFNVSEFILVRLGGAQL